MVATQDRQMQVDPILLGLVKGGQRRSSVPRFGQERSYRSEYVHKRLVAFHSVLLKTVGIRIPIFIATTFEGAHSESLEVL